MSVKLRYRGFGVLAATAVVLALPATVSAAGAPNTTPLQVQNAKFTPAGPARVLDTRTGAKLGQGAHLRLDLSKAVPADATAVTLNLTGTEGTADTHVDAQPGSGVPKYSHLNLTKGETRALQVTVPLATDHSIDLYNKNGSVHVLADLQGYYGTQRESGYAPQNPARVLDTRDTVPINGGQTRTVDFSGLVPDSATAVTFNLTGTDATTATYLTAWRTEDPRPSASSLNLVQNGTTPNLVTVKLGPSKKVNLYNNAGGADAIVDFAGYYTSDGGALFNTVSAKYPEMPVRIYDSRETTQGPIRADQTRTIDPGLTESGIAGYLFNITGVNQSGPTFVTAWDGGPRPATSNLNLAANQTASNAVSMKGSGVVNLYNALGSVHAIADLQGYFTQPE
ncbi:hypothetical protein [Sciscionella sediminilitoris]|uniref:hypothetical protein n=1 Tax=Sciscionella sediminilitoris TaxID=1445613 RepID=UPI0004DF4DD6|nr:hypothetical protein [Sciscionella sp. SE31]